MLFRSLIGRNFDAIGPDKIWSSDVTYLWTREGWLYLAVTMDVGTRRIVGWSMSNRLDAKLVTEALKMALTWRKPQKLIHHSDRGKEYACRAFRNQLCSKNITQSMSRKGDCWDNAVVESFFKSLKSEIGYTTFEIGRAHV